MTTATQPCVVFETPGILDLDFIRLMGVSVKESTDPIGMFGTGLKYATAVILRDGCSMIIRRGKEVHTLTTEKKTLRGTEFNVCLLDGQPLPFTTQLGKKWELWMAYRELYSNTKDESGQIYTLEGETVNGREGITTIEVYGEAFKEVHDTRSEFLLENKTPISVGTAGEIYEGMSRYAFYKGIRAYDLGAHMANTYNITKTVELTEDRTLRYRFQLDEVAARTIKESTNKEVIIAAVTAPENTYEERLNYTTCGGYASNVFKEQVTLLKRSRAKGVSESASQVAGVVEDLPYDNPDNIETDQEDLRAVSEAVAFLADIGFKVTEFTIKVVQHLGPGVMGLAHHKTNTIYIATDPLEFNPKTAAATLLEEYFHLKYNYEDETYAFQTFLHKVIIKLGNELKNERSKNGAKSHS